jgi:prolyl 4-hydroxylase
MNHIMTKTALSSLPKEWQTWVIENVERGCETASMAAVMINDGRFERNLSYAAIEEARMNRSGQPPRAAMPLPRVDTASNTIRTPDRAVDVLFTLANPRIVLLGNVLADDECDALCAHVERKLTRSPVIGDDDGSTQLVAARTSRGAMLERGETELIARVEKRLAALANWPVDHAEGLQVQYYETGNEYRPHYDWFDSSMPGPRKHMEIGGQRVATFVLYLSDVEQGGGTAFPGLGLEVQPKKGNAVYFANTDVYGTPDRDTLHAGMPVVKGAKYIANKWLRERKY